VDGDDGLIDGSGLNGDSFFGSGFFTFVFDSSALGSLPTSAGIVWTDGDYGAGTWFEALDGGGNRVCYAEAAIADASNNGETAEDRFFGCNYSGGIGWLRIGNSNGGIEADHLQYGGGQAVSTPEPGSLALLGLGLAGLGYVRRRKLR
jgi:hypothetical protein